MTFAISMSAHDPTDGELLTRFATSADQAAFEALVRRHIDWVYAAALRITRDPANAEDVTQAVFWSLAQKAPFLAHRSYVGGWLHEAARLAACALLRSERRRKERERVIAQQNAETQTPLARNDLQDQLDAAIARLPAHDRSVILLRFLQRKTHEEIALQLGITAEAARKRVVRALEKLRLTLRPQENREALGAALIAGSTIKARSELLAAVLSGKVSTKAALLAKGITAMQKRFALKLVLAAAAIAACAGIIVGAHAMAQTTPPPANPQTAMPSPAVTPPIVAEDSTPANAPQVARAAFGGGGGGPRRAGDGGGMVPGIASIRGERGPKYDITVTTTLEGAVTAQVKDKNGKLIFDGSFVAAADRAKFPTDALPVIDQLNKEEELGKQNQPNPMGLMAAPTAQSLDSIRQQLGATDDQWAGLQDRIGLILKLQNYLSNGKNASWQWNPTATSDADNPIQGPVRDLTNALADNSTKPEDLDAKVDAIRSARREVEDSLAKNRQKLEAAVTPRQKAVLVNLQILE